MGESSTCLYGLTIVETSKSALWVGKKLLACTIMVYMVSIKPFLTLVMAKVSVAVKVVSISMMSLMQFIALTFDSSIILMMVFS